MNGELYQNVCNICIFGLFASSFVFCAFAARHFWRASDQRSYLGTASIPASIHTGNAKRALLLGALFAVTGIIFLILPSELRLKILTTFLGIIGALIVLYHLLELRIANDEELDSYEDYDQVGPSKEAAHRIWRYHFNHSLAWGLGTLTCFYFALNVF
jgi:hypothetical protein